MKKRRAISRRNFVGAAAGTAAVGAGCGSRAGAHEFFTPAELRALTAL